MERSLKNIKIMIISSEQQKFLIDDTSSSLENWIDGNPFELEIGCGKGAFLIQRSSEVSDHRLLGLDWSWKWMKVGMERCIKQNLKNIRYFRGDAGMFLEKNVPKASIDICHIYFPDPWPKKRHHKRRLFNNNFLETLHSKLKDKGIVHIATDHLEYYNSIQGTIYETKVLWKQIKQTHKRYLFPNCTTNYERKYEKEKRPLSFIQLEKF